MADRRDGSKKCPRPGLHAHTTAAGHVSSAHHCLPQLALVDDLGLDAKRESYRGGVFPAGMRPS